eukprot:SM000090S24350  [mRNA]  locus=s90:524146:528597:+ [translate_table: standard]
MAAALRAASASAAAVAPAVKHAPAVAAAGAAGPSRLALARRGAACSSAFAGGLKLGVPAGRFPRRQHRVLPIVSVHTGDGNTQSQTASRLRREADNLGREAEEGLSSLENLDWKVAGAEFAATAMFTFLGCGAAVASGKLLLTLCLDMTDAVQSYSVYCMLGAGMSPARLLFIAIAHAVTITSLASTVSGISGGHINPAVTAAMLVVGKETGASALTKVAAQCLGSIFGAWLLWVVTPLKMVGDFGTHALGPGVSPAQGLLMEVILTFGLVFTIFGTVVDERGQSNLAPIPIGMAVLAGILVGGPYTGGSMNPARSLGPAVISGLFARPFWIYLAGPTIGAILAALFYRLFMNVLGCHQCIGDPLVEYRSLSLTLTASEAPLIRALAGGGSPNIFQRIINIIAAIFNGFIDFFTRVKDRILGRNTGDKLKDAGKKAIGATDDAVDSVYKDSKYEAEKAESKFKRGIDDAGDAVKDSIDTAKDKKNTW